MYRLWDPVELWVRKFGKLSIKENLVMEMTFNVVMKSGALLLGFPKYIYISLLEEGNLNF